jgi:8-oxo-dGTP pyrophosphatase MutT (NUDIX family)
VRDRRDDEVRRLEDALRRHTPRDERERRSRLRTLALLRWLAAPFDEEADPTHVTGSAIVVDGAGRVLLHRHKRLGIWLQPGGHVDRGESAADAAVRETSEETGVEAAHPAGSPYLLHIDVHEGPRGHVHLDVRYLLLADGDAPLQPAAGESPDVAWFGPAEVRAFADASLCSAVGAAEGTPTVTRSRGGPR